HSSRSPPAARDRHTVPSDSQVSDRLVYSWLNRDADDLVAESYRGAIDDAAGELAAGGVDVVAARAAHGREDPALQELVAEALDGRGARAPVARTRKWIERNEIDLGGMAVQQTRKRARLRRRIVNPVEHDVLEGHAAAVLLVQVVPAGRQQFGDRMLLVDRHQLVAQRVVRGVQRHRQSHVGLFGQSVDLWHETRSGERHAPARQVEAEIVQQDPQRRHHVAEVRQRLAHAHEDYVGDVPFGPGCGVGCGASACRALQLARGEPYLAHDLGGAQIAIEALLRGGAEGAVERAADLRGDAQRAAVRLRDEDNLEGLRRVGAQQPLARTV